VLHYDTASGALLRNGKVNGSETAALAAAKLVDLVDAAAARIEPVKGGETVVATEDPSANPVLDEARMLLLAQRKPRGITWCLSNLGATPAVVERLAGLGLLVDERKPAAPLTAPGLEELGRLRAVLDPLIVDGAQAGSSSLATLLDAGKLWRNVYPGRDRAEQAVIAERFAAVSAATRSGGDRDLVLHRLRSESRAA
jgi:hypothetical protein